MPIALYRVMRTSSAAHRCFLEKLIRLIFVTEQFRLVGIGLAFANAIRVMRLVVHHKDVLLSWQDIAACLYIFALSPAL